MWEDLDEDQFGSAHQLELTGFAEPVRLDPTVNLTPLLRDRGGVVKLNNSYSFLDHPSLDFLFDGDYDTAFSGLRGDQSGSAFVKSIWFGLGGLFPISRVVIQPTTDHHHDRFIPEFTLGTNDGDEKEEGDPRRELLVSRPLRRLRDPVSPQGKHRIRPRPAPARRADREHVFSGTVGKLGDRRARDLRRRLCLAGKLHLQHRRSRWALEPGQSTTPVTSQRC